MIREALAAITLTAIATVAGVNEHPPTPRCLAPELPIKQTELLNDLLTKNYSVNGKKYLGLIKIKGLINQGQINFSVVYPIQRNIQGMYPGGHFDFDYSGAPVPVRVNGWFDGEEGDICVHDFIDGEWVTKMSHIEVEILKHEKNNYVLRFEVEGVPISLKVKLKEAPTSR